MRSFRLISHLPGCQEGRRVWCALSTFAISKAVYNGEVQPKFIITSASAACVRKLAVSNVLQPQSSMTVARMLFTSWEFAASDCLPLEVDLHVYTYIYMHIKVLPDV